MSSPIEMLAIDSKSGAGSSHSRTLPRTLTSPVAAMASLSPATRRRISILTVALFSLVAHTAFAEANKPGWWRDAVFYEIFVRSFADAKQGPMANDGIGDLQGLIDHLDYLNDGRGAD